MDHVRQYGSLVQRSINPALAWPARLDQERGECLKEHLEAILADQGIDANFSMVPYHSADDLRRNVERSGCDTVLAVLPEGFGHCWEGFYEARNPRSSLAGRYVLYQARHGHEPAMGLECGRQRGTATIEVI
jgi:hypothetical protein